ncbi:hypothetical protein PITC_006810 [Penicillium italicum]|uniref:Uncharacterized protein n=1 Tax=Penicillium italicum TaxID=40296 RepID=A0A0A2LCY3_PENIT|nr:hypothetical protein PITC_006810 [Penicillium italicum]
MVNQHASPGLTHIETRPTSSHLPSLRDIRTSNGQQLHNDDPDACTVLGELISFVSATFTNQAHMGGMTTAVADYLAWARRAPDVNYPLILQILEARLRETAKIANTKHWVEFQNLQASLGKSETFKRKLSMLENELKNAESDTTDYFNTHYDIHSTVDLQLRS